MTCREVSLTDEQVFQFNQNGFLIIENLIDEEMVDLLRARFELLFAGEFETGIYPDECMGQAATCDQIKSAAA